MPRIRFPRSGSMQFWPRKRAKSPVARVRNWADKGKAQALCFCGYKAGMTHLIVKNNNKNSITKGEDVHWPVTVIECPPLKVASLRLYKKNKNALSLASEIFSEKLDKELGRKIPIPKKQKSRIDEIKPEEYFDIRLMVYTMPKLCGFGKKTPELFEVGIGGGIEEKLKYAKDVLGKEIRVSDVFSAGQQVDIHSITKGKGFQGPVKRFGIGIRNHKSEKTKRGPGSLGGWSAQGKVMYRVSHAGQMGFQQRFTHNILITKIGENPKEINPKGGFVNYGIVKNQYVLLKGTVSGPSKRMIKMTVAMRPDDRVSKEAPPIAYTSLSSKQGN